MFIDYVQFVSSIFQAIRTAGQPEEEPDNTGPRRVMSQEEKFRKVLVETIIRWGCEEEIESTDLGEKHKNPIRHFFHVIDLQCVRCSPCCCASTTPRAS